MTWNMELLMTYDICCMQNTIAYSMRVRVREEIIDWCITDHSIIIIIAIATGECGLSRPVCALHMSLQFCCARERSSWLHATFAGQSCSSLRLLGARSGLQQAHLILFWVLACTCKANKQKYASEYAHRVGLTNGCTERQRDWWAKGN